MTVKAVLAVSIILLGCMAVRFEAQHSELYQIIKKVFLDRSASIEPPEVLQLCQRAQSLAPASNLEFKYIDIINELVRLCTEGDRSICDNWDVFREFRQKNLQSARNARGGLKYCEQRQLCFCSFAFEAKVQRLIDSLSEDDKNLADEFKETMCMFGKYRTNEMVARGIARFIKMKRDFAPPPFEHDEFMVEFHAHITPACNILLRLLGNYVQEFNSKKTYLAIPLASTWFQLVEDCSNMLGNSGSILRKAHQLSIVVD